ncbi:Gfo/Idh/MocA family protein [Modestobacter marinus]|uniref:Gfo/Idh/MocA family protein n=1 Tax=Modestobacter marinus TaxID=477641 RepID=UPI0021BBCAD3|nr:Gfo/Idh/MocA family oxidoreductase [Modestobacter marinus]
MSVPPVRIGLVGYGKGGRLFHAPLIGRAEGCVLGGVVVRSPERRAALAADLRGVPIAGSLTELADVGVDAVVVTTPLDSHTQLVREAVGLGLPVVCDKPFARDAATARETALAAERAGVLLTVYQNRRWDADFRTVQQVVTAGALGEVRLFESRMEQPPQPEGLPVTGGGALLDLGSHAVDQALHLFGPVRSVYAELHLTPEKDGFDEGFFVALRHDGGTISHVTGNWARQGDVGPRFRVDGAAATLVVPDDDGQTARLTTGRTPESEGAAWGTVPESRWGSVHRGGVAVPVPSQQGDWSAFYTGFARAVRGEGPPPVDPWDAVAALEVLDAARTSAATRQVVEPGPTGRPA